MGKERLKILTMLEEGRITPADAVNLLKTIDSQDEMRTSKNPEPFNNNTDSSVESMMDDFNKRTESISSQLSESLSNMDGKLSGILNINFDNLTKNLKYLQQSLESIISGMDSGLAGSMDVISSKLMEQTSSFSNLINEKDIKEADNLKKSMEDIEKKLRSTAFDPSYLYGNLSSTLENLTVSGSNANMYSRVFKKSTVSPSSMSMEFEGINGYMAVEGYDGSEIEATVYYTSDDRTINNVVDITDEPELYRIKAIDSDSSRIFVSIDVKIPKIMFRNIQVVNSNGKINVCDISCESLICTTSNGKISFANLVCSSIECSASGGKIHLSRIKTDKLLAVTHSSPITLDNTYCTTSDIITTSGNILLELNDTVYGHNEYKIENENAAIDVELVVPSDCGIFIDAFCQNGSVNMLEIPNFSYTTRESKSASVHIVGETENYSDCQNCISIIAQTTNCDINIK